LKPFWSLNRSAFFDVQRTGLCQMYAMSPDMAGFGFVFQGHINHFGVICYMRIDKKIEDPPGQGTMPTEIRF
jgi:hypothetical protein